MSKTGILKLKSKYEEKSFDLLVIGYHSKLYRDDIKALELDRESHLIEAPFDATCMISRYDVRATISDITPYETSSTVGINRFDGLSESEKQAEMLAEEERYYSLYRNEVEEELYKEEQLKREMSSANAYSQVAFSYDDQPEIGPKLINEDSSSSAPNDDDSIFIPCDKLQIPSNMEIPPTVKLNQIIEKTAKFIANQGIQMEILLKTKQAANPQFNFLNHDGQFNAYYKHIMSMMKNNTYPWEETSATSSGGGGDGNGVSGSNNVNENTENGNGITPSEESSKVFVPKMQYKPSADCAYTQLISKITKAPISELERKREEANENSDGKKKNKIEALGLLQSYNSSDDDEDDENGNEDEKIPPPEIQVTIDKTALYVAKNGAEFEHKLMEKKSQTFNFLNTDNEYYAYYKKKVKENMTALNITIQPPPAPIITPPIQPKIEVPAVKVPPAPICFSIKAKEEKPPLVKSKISSDDEQQEHSKQQATHYPSCPSPPKISDIEEELERQVDIVNAEREERLAKERLNDKLLISARERLGRLPKEKMLQIERKKRAMMFINKNIKGPNGDGGENKESEEVINLVHGEEDSSSSEKSSSRNKKTSNSRSSRSRSRRHSSTSRSSATSSDESSTSSSSSSRSSDSSPRRKRSKKSHRKRKHRKSSKSRSRSRSSKKHRSRDRSYKYSSRRKR